MRSLRVSTFGDIFFSPATKDTYADALPEDVFLAAVDEAFEQRRQPNIGKAIDRAGFRYPDANWSRSGQERFRAWSISR